MKTEFCGFARNMVWVLLMFMCMTMSTVDALASVPSCQDVFANVTGSNGRRISPPPDGKITWQGFKKHWSARREYRWKQAVYVSEGAETRGLKMAFDVVEPRSNPSGALNAKSSPVAILLHGVGDSRAELKALTIELEKQGWTIIRPDLLGHGETASMNGGTPDKIEPIDYHKQVEMVVGLTRSLGVQNPIVIGHSMGGGLSMAVTKALSDFGIKPIANIPIAPYLSAIDKFLSLNTMSPDLIQYYRDQLREKFGLSANKTILQQSPLLFTWTAAWMKVVMHDCREMLNFFRRFRLEMSLVVADSYFSREARNVMSSMSDPLVIEMMHSMYEKYENAKESMRPEGDRHDSEEISRFVEGAIEATIGLRDLDFQARVSPSPVDATVPTMMISGASDPVVIRPQVEDFKEVAKRNQYDVTFVELEGDHFLPQKQAPTIVRGIVAFLRSRGLIGSQSEIKE